MGKVKSFTDKVWYGTGAIGLDLSYGMFYEKLYYYQTNILKLDTKFLLILSSLARVWDGVNDPMMGSLVDNTNTKFGRYRPWVVTGASLNAVVLFFLLFNPGMKLGAGAVGIYIYAAFMYVLWGMTNTAADIPYWSMVPSFTTDPKERSLLSTVARAFSGLGQGIVSIISPVILNKFGTYNAATDAYDWTAKGYIVCASVFAGMLVFFALFSMSRVKETVHVKEKERFSFRTIFDVLRQNDQLRVFILFALLSNTGFYTVSGVKDHFFNVVVAAESNAGWFTLSKFNLFMTAGSVLGLVVVPIMLKFTSRRRIYQTSLLVAIAGYAGMSFSGLAHQWLLMSISYFINQIGTASMFVSQTVFLSDVVDYGEVKMGKRKESVTFSMKGFLQKMAYTVQTIILNLTLSVVRYNKETDLISSGAQTLYSRRVVNGIKGIMYIVPAICFILSLIVFSTKFKLHGAYMEDITAQVTAAREARIRAAETGAEEAGS